MTLEELLKSKGLTDEQTTAILEAMKENKIFTAGEENLDIRYGKLKQDYDALTTQHGESTKLIEKLQKDNKGNADLQQAVETYKQQVAALQAQNAKDKLDYALRLALMEEKAVDVDYLAYKAREKHPEWAENPSDALDENGKLKGADELRAGLKTQFPQQFEVSATRKVVPQRLPGQTEERGTITRSEILKKPYSERAKLYADNPEAYNEAMKH